MRTFPWAIALAALGAGCTATGVLSSDQPPIAAAQSEVPGAYDRYCYDTRTDIPDGDQTGVLIGPLRTLKSGGFISDLVLSLDISHGYTGDVAVELCYDVDNDGTVDARAPVDLFRVRTDAFANREAMAYPTQLEGRYFFRDDDSIETRRWDDAFRGIAVDQTPTPSRAFSVLRGLRCGGSFYLAVADTLAQKSGRVHAWSVLLRKAESGLAQRTSGGCK